MAGTKLSAELVLKLVGRLPNFAGTFDASLDWQFMINVISNAQRARAAFQLVSGTEYMISAGAIGATAMLSSLAGIAPVLVRHLYEHCRAERYAEARPAQEALAALRQAVKAAGVAGLKGAMREVGRDCGKPRPPNEPLNARARKALAAALAAIPALAAEPRGW
jgi:4-hydroxy-tetrahydrodipicolinate synthase